MTGHWPRPGQHRTTLADWVDAHQSAEFWSAAALTFCAWARVDPELSRRLRGADTPALKLRLAALLALAAHHGRAPIVRGRARDLHDAARAAGVPVITADTYRQILTVLTAALRDHGVPRDIVEDFCAVFHDLGPSVVDRWELRLHPYLRPRPGVRQLSDSAALADFEHCA